MSFDYDSATKVIDNAIIKLKLYEPNPLIREKAEVFIKMHLLPTFNLLTVRDDKIEAQAYVLDIALVGKNVKDLKNYLDMHTDELKDFERFVSKALRNDPEFIDEYINTLIRILRFLGDMALCRRVVDYIIWSYDEMYNKGQLISKMKSYFGDEHKVSKAMYEFSKFVVSMVVDFNNGLKNYISGKKSRPSYGEFLVVSSLLKYLDEKECFFAVEANEDYFYMGIVKGIKKEINPLEIRF